MSAEYYGVLYLHKYQLQQRWYTEDYRRSVRTGSILSIVKITLIRLHHDDLLKNLCNAANNWACNIVRQDYRQVMLRYTNLGRVVFFFQMGSEYVVIVSLTAGPLLSTSPSLENITRSEKQMQLPHEMICPSNVPVVCYDIYILQTVQLMFTSMGNVGSDVFLFGVYAFLQLIGDTHPGIIAISQKKGKPLLEQNQNNRISRETLFASGSSRRHRGYIQYYLNSTIGSSCFAYMFIRYNILNKLYISCLSQILYYFIIIINLIL